MIKSRGKNSSRFRDPSTGETYDAPDPKPKGRYQFRFHNISLGGDGYTVLDTSATEWDRVTFNYCVERNLAAAPLMPGTVCVYTFVDTRGYRGSDSGEALVIHAARVTKGKNNPARFHHRRLASPHLFRPGSFRTVTPRGRPDVRVVVAKRPGRKATEAQAILKRKNPRFAPWSWALVEWPAGAGKGRFDVLHRGAYFAGVRQAKRHGFEPPKLRKISNDAPYLRAFARGMNEKAARSNPARSGLVEIYPRVTRVEMQKGSGAAKPVRNGRFYHDFKPGTRALGLPRGARIVDARGRPLKSLGKRSILLVNEE
jgi:hypothetical protein